MSDLPASAWMEGGPPHRAQALRDFALQAPYEWQRLFLDLADLVEEAAEGKEETREAALALYEAVETVRDRHLTGSPAAKALTKALDEFAEKVEV